MRNYFVKYILVFCLVIGLITGCGKKKESVFRDINWDDSYNSIVELEKGKGSNISIGKTWICVEDVSAFGKTSDRIEYHFADDGLYLIQVYFQSISGYDRIESEFIELKNEVSLVYGDPVSEYKTSSASWSKEGFIVELEWSNSLDCHYIELTKQ